MQRELCKTSSNYTYIAFTKNVGGGGGALFAGKGVVYNIYLGECYFIFRPSPNNFCTVQS